MSNAFPIRWSDALNIPAPQREHYEALGVQPIAAQDITTTLAAMIEHAACNLPEDFLRALRFGLDHETSDNGRDIYRQILDNAARAAAAGRPTCQDTGQAVVFVDLGRDVRIVGDDLETAVNRGVALGYKTLRASIIKDALFDRRNTGDNTPAVLHVRLVEGREVHLHIAEKGYGSENKSLMTMYPYPQGGEEAVLKFVLDQVKKAGADWCPPGILSLAVGGNFEQAPMAAKRLLLEPFDMDLLLAKAERNPTELTPNERFRVRLFKEVNEIGIGPQGLGGLTTVLDVKLVTLPTHIAGMPIAMNVQCNKAAHLGAVLDGSGPVTHFPTPDFAAWAVESAGPVQGARRLKLPLDRETRKALRIGDRLLLSGRILTGRDAAHKRMIDTIKKGEPLPVDLRDQLIYYVGPIDPVPGEVVGPAGPTTSSRMDPYTPLLLEKTGMAGAIGKGERGPETAKAFAANGAVFMVTTGGAGYLQAQTIKKAEVLAYPDLGPEAIRAFEVEDFPCVVAVDTEGGNLHETGRLKYAVKS